MCWGKRQCNTYVETYRQTEANKRQGPTDQQADRQRQTDIQRPTGRQIETDRQTDRDRQAERQRPTGRQKETDRQTDGYMTLKFVYSLIGM